MTLSLSWALGSPEEREEEHRRDVDGGLEVLHNPPLSTALPSLFHPPPLSLALLLRSGRLIQPICEIVHFITKAKTGVLALEEKEEGRRRRKGRQKRTRKRRRTKKKKGKTEEKKDRTPDFGEWNN
jgi:hypothetical protein